MDADGISYPSFLKPDSLAQSGPAIPTPGGYGHDPNLIATEILGPHPNRGTIEDDYCSLRRHPPTR